MGMVADALGQLVLQGRPARPPTPTDLPPALVGFFGPPPPRPGYRPPLERYARRAGCPPKGTVPRQAYGAALRRVERKPRSWLVQCRRPSKSCRGSDVPHRSRPCSGR